MSRYIKVSVKRKIGKIANGYCEYCKSRDDFSTRFFEFDHIIQISKNGSNAFENITRSFRLCNRNKSDKGSVLDIITNQKYPLFNPRKYNWDKHFKWNDYFTKMIALTPIGRVTVLTLGLNRNSLLNIRKALILLKKHPPK